MKNILTQACKNYSNRKELPDATKTGKSLNSLCLLGDLRFFTGRPISGTVFALTWVGQRDTRWLTPLTVSAVTRVRKVTANYMGATDNPTTVAPFIFSSARLSFNESFAVSTLLPVRIAWEAEVFGICA
jgi:hypothetical protein